MTPIGVDWKYNASGVMHPPNAESDSDLSSQIPVSGAFVGFGPCMLACFSSVSSFLFSFSRSSNNDEWFLSPHYLFLGTMTTPRPILLFHAYCSTHFQMDKPFLLCLFSLFSLSRTIDGKVFFSLLSSNFCLPKRSFSCNVSWFLCLWM